MNASLHFSVVPCVMNGLLTYFTYLSYTSRGRKRHLHVAPHGSAKSKNNNANTKQSLNKAKAG